MVASPSDSAAKDWHIGIANGTWANKGGEAMTHTAAREIANRLHGTVHCTVFVERAVPAIDCEQDLPTVLVRATAFSVVRDLLLGMLYRITRKEWFLSRSPLLSRLKQLDAFVDVHGYYIRDEVGIRALFFPLLLLRLCSLIGTPVYMLPQSVGPLRKASHKYLTWFLLPKNEWLCVRSTESERWLREGIGVRPVVYRNNDVAFLFPAADADSAVRKPSGKMLWGISVNTNIPKRNPQYASVLADVIAYLVREHDAEVWLIPHEHKQKGKKDDVDLCKTVYALLPEECAPSVRIQGDARWDAARYKDVIGQCDYLIASRFHAAVAALSMNVPTITVGWSFKYTMLMRSVGIERYAIDGRSPVLFTQIINAAETIIAREHIVRSILSRTVASAKKSVRSLFDEIAIDIRAKSSV